VQERSSAGQQLQLHTTAAAAVHELLQCQTINYLLKQWLFLHTKHHATAADRVVLGRLALSINAAAARDIVLSALCCWQHSAIPHTHLK